MTIVPKALLPGMGLIIPPRKRKPKRRVRTANSKAGPAEQLLDSRMAGASLPQNNPILQAGEGGEGSDVDHVQGMTSDDSPGRQHFSQVQNTKQSTFWTSASLISPLSIRGATNTMTIGWHPPHWLLYLRQQRIGARVLRQPRLLSGNWTWQEAKVKTRTIPCRKVVG